jgi:hypothetical protein
VARRGARGGSPRAGERSPAQAPSQAIGAGNRDRREGDVGGEAAGMWTTRREGRGANGGVKDDGDPAMRLRGDGDGEANQGIKTTIHARFPPTCSSIPLVSDLHGGKTRACELVMLKEKGDTITIVLRTNAERI